MVLVWRCQCDGVNVTVSVWRRDGVIVTVWRCRCQCGSGCGKVTLSVWRCQFDDVSVTVWQCDGVTVWRCQCDGVTVWRCNGVAAWWCQCDVVTLTKWLQLGTAEIITTMSVRIDHELSFSRHWLSLWYPSPRHKVEIFETVLIREVSAAVKLRSDSQTTCEFLLGRENGSTCLSFV